MKRKAAVILIVILAVVLALFGVVTLRLGAVIRTAVNRLGPAVLKVPVSVESVSVHPLRGTFKLNSLTIGNPEGYSSEYLFHLDEMRLKLVMAELMRGDIHFSEIIITGPHVWYDRKLRRSNVSDLLDLLESDAAKEKVEKPKDDTKPKKSVVIDYFEMKSGRVGVKVGVGVNLPLPAIELKNIGRDRALMPVQVVRLLLVNIFKGVLGTVSGVGELAVDGVKEVGNVAVDGVKGVGKAVGGIVSGLLGDKTNTPARPAD